MDSWAAVILAGGRASRMDGRDKVAIEIDGTTLLARAVDAAAGAEPIVVVGKRRPVPRPVLWTVEDEPGSGPVAAIAAGLAQLPDDPDLPVVLLAADLPRLTGATLARLLGSLGTTGAVLVDADGRDQWLLSAWRLGALRAALPERPEGMALRKVLGGLDPVRVAAVADEAADVDTPEDLSRFTR